MRTFIYESVEEAYPQIIKALLEEGEEVSPRGKLTKELTPACVTITNPKKRVIPSNTRKLNFGFMCAELIWILEASNDVNMISHYNSNWKLFSDDGETLNGAYGKRIFSWDAGVRFEKSIKNIEEGTQENTFSKHVFINQFQQAYNQLKLDVNTRQATIVFFDPYKDYKETKDKPCTNLIRFMIRNNKLNMTVFMRSNDIWFGFPYDVFNFTMLQEIMAGMLGIEVGIYNHIVDSLHIYEEHFEIGKQIVNENQSLLYNNCIDARISMQQANDIMNIIFNLEKITRENKEVPISDITTNLDNLSNNYWQSVIAVIVLYNFRKYGRPQDELDIIKKYITNEFSILTKNWNQK